MDVVVLSETSSREDLTAALAEFNRRAEREPHVLGTAERPSRWDEWHATVDQVLGWLVGR